MPVIYLRPAVILPVCPTWECTSLTWPSLRRGRQTTPKTTWSTSPRWEWWGARGSVTSEKTFKRVFLWKWVYLPCFIFARIPDFSHHQRNQAVPADGIQDWPATKGDFSFLPSIWDALYFSYFFCGNNRCDQNKVFSVSGWPVSSGQELCPGWRKHVRSVAQNWAKSAKLMEKLASTFFPLLILHIS